MTILACLIGLWMAWGVGANDLANIASPAIGSRAINVRQAVMIAVVFEIAGAFLGGAEVTHTIRGGIINLAMIQSTPHLFVYCMLSVLLAGAVWINVASFLGMPVSITNTIVGALVGVGALMLGLHAVHWKAVGYIALSWICSPTIAGAVAFLLFISIRQSILGAEKPFQAAKRVIPIYLLLVGIVLSIMMTLKTFKHFHIVLTGWQTIGVMSLSTLLVFLIGFYAMRHLQVRSHFKRQAQFVYIEGMFSVLMAFTACAMVFAHGSNDVAITVGPVLGVVSQIGGSAESNGWWLSSLTLFACVSVILGLFMHGRKVIETVGSSITTLTPSRAFAATLAASSTVVVSTSIGIPVSATQTLVGAVFGVGLARGIDALNLNVIRNIFMSWIVTIPVAALLATGVFLALKITLSP